MLSSIGYVVSLLSLRSLEEHVTLKRKALDDFIDSSQHPARKRHACTSYLPQAPVAFVTACDIPKPAKARRGTLSRSYAIADLNEIPLDVWAPGCQSGPAISQARDLCDGAKSKLMKGAEAKTSEVGRQSAEQDSKNMSKRKALEEVPSGSSPQTPKRRSLSHSPVIANLIIPTLSTTYSAVQSPHWPFPNELVLNILEKLSALDLRSIAQTPKYLRCNLLDADDRHLKALLGFLESFEGTQVFFVSIVKDGEMLGDFAPLFHLRVLAGPLWYLASLLQKVRVPLHIQTLKLYLDEESLASAPNYLSAILDITQQFIAIDCLGLSFYHQSLISGSFDLPLDEYRTIPVRKIRCSPWLGVFDHVEEVYLKPGNITSSERLELKDAFHCPEHPYHLDIGSYF
ncbi:hypothetical protein BD769DRAFT_1392737 [Suillus cothurnatus]|nr:hypothetical protein BD769DRAFT_1392737 [Suillus cothurnatus]